MNFASIKFYVDFIDDKPYAHTFSFAFKLNPEFDNDKIKEIIKQELLKDIESIVEQHTPDKLNRYGLFIEASDESLRSK